jgi:two-component system chemotaxis sensor kinase CheA
MKSDRPIKEFLAEAEDILEAINSSLSELETDRAEGRSDPEQVNALFRAIHTFKGLSGMFDLKEPAELSHKLEFFLDELRLGKVGLSNDAATVLTDTAALLGRLVQQAGRKQPFEDISPALSRIDAILTAKPSTMAEGSIADQINLDRGILQVLTEYEEHRLRECIREKRKIYLLKTEFDLSNFEEGIKDLNKTLKKHGEIICTLPTAGGAGIGFSIVLGTEEEQGGLLSAITIPNVSIEKISYVESLKNEEMKTVDGVLRSTSNTVRVDIYKLDRLMGVVGEMHLLKNVIARISKDLRTMQGFTGLSVDLHKAHRGLERKLNELQEGILEVRMVPLGQIFTRLAQLVKKYSKDAQKDIGLEVHGEETELDKLMIEDLADPLMHLIRNAIDHGIEPPNIRKQLGKPEKGRVRLAAFPKGNHVVITVEDDGAGLDAAAIAARAVEKGILTPDHGLDPVHDSRAIFDLIFLPGFTTREMVTEISGRGVGMDVVKSNMSKLSGMIDIQSEAGKGTTFFLTIPITLAIIKALVVESGGQTFAIPLSSVLEIQQATAKQVETVEGREVMAVRDDTIPLLRVSSVFNLPDQGVRDSFYVIIVGLAERRLGVIVESLHDQQEIVIKTLGKRLANIAGIAGATELGGQQGVVLVLDVESLIDGALKKTAAPGK